MSAEPSRAAPHCTALYCTVPNVKQSSTGAELYAVCCMVYGLEVPVVLVMVSMVLGGFNSVGKSFAVYFEHECRQIYMYARSV
jgi:hypothetical protein